MKITDLYKMLLKVYSDENLNRISAKLIEWYKSKNWSIILELASQISKYIPVDEYKGSKCFSRLIMLYHPDKGEHFRNAIKKLYEQNDYANLKQYTHILCLDDIDNIVTLDIDETIDYNVEYVWDNQSEEGFNFTDSDGNIDFENKQETEEYERSFFNLIKIREYGTIDISLPTYYLEDFEEFEMAYSRLETLSGVEYCKHVKILDVSNNALTEINDLWGLQDLEELYLSNNIIGYIDTLSNLLKLKIVDLSGNQIDDINPLMQLPVLEYVNLFGNEVPANQVELLKEKGVVVII